MIASHRFSMKILEVHHLPGMKNPQRADKDRGKERGEKELTELRAYHRKSGLNVKRELLKRGKGSRTAIQSAIGKLL